MTTYGRYQLLERLGRGGMAEVFLARMNGPMNVSRYVALKRILSDFSNIPELNDMFLDEIRLAVHLSHPSIGAVHDFGMEEGCIFLTMELIEGQDLRSVLRRALQGHRMSLECALYIVAQVARALHYAHGASDAQERPLGIVHRDITPSNVLVSYRGDVKLVDFGIARAASHVRLNHTRAGEIKGTIRYMSPEQAAGSSIDWRSDLFSLTTVLLETVIGRPAFKAENDVQALKLVQAGRAPERDQFVELIPDDVGAIIDRGMVADPAGRYQSGDEMATDLEIALRNRVPAFGPSNVARVMGELFATELAELKRRMRAHAEGLAAVHEESSFSSVIGVADTCPAIDTPSTVGELQRRSGEPRSGEPRSNEPPAPPLQRRRIMPAWLRNSGIVLGSAVAAVVAAFMLMPRLSRTSAQAAQGAHAAVGAPATPPAASPAAPPPAPVEPVGSTVTTKAEPTAPPAAAHVTARVTPHAVEPLRAEPTPAEAPAPAAAPPPMHKSYGTLNLQSAPWAVVEIDGKNVGQTPLVEFRLTSGRHRVTLTNPGLPKKTLKIVVPANQPVNQTVTLTD